MPSPIAHAAVGYVIYRAFRSRKAVKYSFISGKIPLLLMATVGLSLLPDLDSIPGIIAGDFGRFHNAFTNSIFSGAGVALGIGAAVWLWKRSGFRYWLTIALICYELHVLMDLFTVGRGVMLVWPLSSERIEPAVKLFYGLRWSEGVVSAHHLWTLVTELGFVVLLGLGTVLIGRRRRGERQKEEQTASGD